MRSRRIYLVVLFLSGLLLSTAAQNLKVDSLKIVLRNIANRSEKIDLLFKLAKESLNAGLLKEAKNYSGEALVLARQTGNKYYIRDCFAQVNEVAVRSNDFKNACEYFKCYILYRDSILAEVNTKKKVKAEMQYEFDKKAEAAKALQDKINFRHEARARQQRIVLLIVIIGLLLVTVFSVFLFNRFRLITRQKKIIEIQKDEVEAQRKLADERRKITEEQSALIGEKQKEILDSIRYAYRIQKALTPSDKYIEKKLAHLKNR